MPPRTPRMPRLDELPVPAQNEILAQRGELPQAEHPGRRKSLLERLASVGLGRREQGKDEETPPRDASGRAATARAAHRTPDAARRPIRARNPFPNTPSEPRRRGSTSTGDRLLCITRTNRISLKSQHSSADRRIDAFVRSATDDRIAAKAAAVGSLGEVAG